MSQDINWKKEVETRQEDLLNDLKMLLSIDSVRDDSKATEEYPVGPGPAEALDAFLELAEEDGFQTENFDNLAGHIEYGEGSETLGILAHVDVVPVGTGWETEPFNPVIKDDRLYARGASDDKGPGMAAYYALKIIKELELPVSKRIRFIIGTDEESDWKGMDHYFEVEDMPDFGFSPDANFPVINGEKGNVSVYLESGGKGEGEEMSLLHFQSGLRENMVPQDAEAAVKMNDTAAFEEAFENYLNEHPVTGQTRTDDETVTLSVVGKASHGAQPQNGENAGTYLADFLAGQTLENDARLFVETVSTYLHDDPFGKKAGVAVTDEVMGDLTMNVGVLEFKEGEGGKISTNFRFPKNTDGEQIKNKIEETVSDTLKVTRGDSKEPHYVPADDPLVETLLHVYEKQTGLKGHEQVIGGGTYGRLLDRGVAYGAMFPDSVDTMHQANEFIALDDLFRATAIYAEAIYELVK